MLFIVVLGGAAFAGLPRQEDPKMAERYGMVVTFLPGATAQRMETLISEPIETALREIPDIKELNSSSKGGQSVVGIELYESVADAQTDNVWSQVRDILGDTVPMLPPGTVEPELEVNQPIASTIIVAISWQHPSQPQMGILSRLRNPCASTSPTRLARKSLKPGAKPKKKYVSPLTPSNSQQAV